MFKTQRKPSIFRQKKQKEPLVSDNFIPCGSFQKFLFTQIIDSEHDYVRTPNTDRFQYGYS